MKKNSKQNSPEVNLTIGDLFANKNSFKPVKIKGKFIINNFLTIRDFKKNKLSKKYLNKNFIYKKPEGIVKEKSTKLKKCFISKKAYYSAHPHKLNAKIVLGALKKAVATVAIVVVGYFGLKYGPAAVKFVSNWRNAKRLPQTKIMTEYNPEQEDNNGYYIVTNTQKPDIKSESISSETKQSYNELKQSLNNLAEEYACYEENISPIMISVDEENNLINLFCQSKNSKIVKFVFDIYDESKVEEVFNFNKILSTDFINGLRTLLTDENISDIPEIMNYVNTTAVATDVKEEMLGNIVDGEYIENDYFTFYVTELQDDGKVFEKEVKILKANALTLNGFDGSNLNSLIGIFKTNNNAFDSTIIKEYESNVANSIFNSLNAQKNDEQTL